MNICQSVPVVYLVDGCVCVWGDERKAAETLVLLSSFLVAGFGTELLLNVYVIYGETRGAELQDWTQLNAHSTCRGKTHQCCTEFHRWRLTSHVRVWTSPAALCVGKSSWLQWSSAALVVILAFVTLAWSSSGHNMALKSVLSALKRTLDFHINHVKHMEWDCCSSVWLIWSLSALCATDNLHMNHRVYPIKEAFKDYKVSWIKSHCTLSINTCWAYIWLNVDLYRFSNPTKVSGKKSAKQNS